MFSLRIRKFAISVDPEEVVDFAESLSYFEDRFQSLGFDKIGTYKFRYSDRECSLTAELVPGVDGFEVWVSVQAPDEHEYRINELAEEFDAYVIAAATTGRHTGKESGIHFGSGAV